MSQVNIIFNGEKIQADSGMTILDLAEEKGIEIPTLCHDKRLSPYGSCFLCVVEVKRAKTLMPACATKLAEGMEIETNNNKVMSSRKTVLELILSAHSGDCLAPCKLTCPAGCDIQGYVGLVANSKYRDAIKLIKETIPFPASIGRVCPKFCEDKCRRQYVEEPVAIDNIKRFAADIDLESGSPYMPDVLPKTGKKVAIIGGGPTGLSAAYYLVQNGIDVEVFEAKPYLGGMLRYGIPQYRLPKEILDKELSTITGLGMKINTNSVLGKDFTIKSLKEKGFDAVLLATGAWKAQSMRIPNEDADNILNGIKFLELVAEKKDTGIYGKVAIVGGGNTAFDCARTAVRLGASEVVVIYRRTEDEMPAEQIEKIEACEEGVRLMLLTAPVDVVKEGNKATGLVLRKMELGEPDASGRRKPVPIEGSDFTEPFDFIIPAIGQNPDFNILGEYKDTLAEDGRKLSYDKDTCQTGVDYIFAAGDYSLGASTVVEGIGEAKKAAMSIVKYLKGEPLTPPKEYVSVRELTDPSDPFFTDWKKTPRVIPVGVCPGDRKDNFNEIESTYSPEKAEAEANRCMECGCMDVYECSLKKYSEDYGAVEDTYKGQLNIFKNDDTGRYLFREPSKCILCGRCVRLCSEKVNVGVYGYVKRGFESIVMPSFGTPISESDCIECGTCISGCPVGAIIPKQNSAKKVPLKTKKTDTYCFYCSVGCKTSVSTLDDSIHEIQERDNYLCERGRFHFPEVPSPGNFDINTLKNYKSATVHLSASLSAEDYEALKAMSEGLNWKLSNYYSQSGLWQAFAKSKTLPAMDFFTTDLNPQTTVVIAGDIEHTNPVAINRLNIIVKEDTRLIHLDGKPSLRLKNMGAAFIDSPAGLKDQLGESGEIILLINPVDYDKNYGTNASLELYNMITGTGIKVRTTLFSDRKNLYSFYDADKTAPDTPINIFINEYSDDMASVVVIDNGKTVLSTNFDCVIGNNGIYLNSRNEYYKNTGIFETATMFDYADLKKVEIKKHANLKEEKPL